MTPQPTTRSFAATPWLLALVGSFRGGDRAKVVSVIAETAETGKEDVEKCPVRGQLMIAAALALGGLLPNFLNAQMTLVSNLNQPNAGAFGFGHSDSTPTSAAMMFTTGSEGVTISGLTIAFGNASGPASNLSVSLYRQVTQGVGPSGLITTFAYSVNPLTQGLYNFSGVATLNPSTNYYVVLTDSSVGNGIFSYYSWQRTLSLAEDVGGLPGASIGDFYILNYGPLFHWDGYAQAPAKFSVNIAAVPEASAYGSIAGLAAIAWVAWSRRKTAPK